MRNSFSDCANGSWFIDGSVGSTYETTIESTSQRTIQRYIGNADIGIAIENPVWQRWTCPMDLTVSQVRIYADNTVTTEITGTWCGYNWTPAWTEAYLAAP